MAGKQPYHDEETLRELYHKQDMSLSEIADKFDVAESTIWSWLDRYDIEITYHGRPEDRFEQQYEVNEETGCWEWTGTRHNFGYGQFGVDGGTMGAHRYSYKLHNDGIPDGAHICHKCNNPPCVNPDHLYAGSPKSNAQDAIEAGSFPHEGSTKSGEENRHSHINNDDVRKMRERYANSDVTYTELSDEYDISMGAVSRMIRGESYKDAGGPTDIDTHSRMARRGEKANTAKLKESDVAEIRSVYSNEDISMADLGDRYGVSASAVCSIVNHETWDHI